MAGVVAFVGSFGRSITYPCSTSPDPSMHAGSRPPPPTCSVIVSHVCTRNGLSPYPCFQPAARWKHLSSCASAASAERLGSSRMPQLSGHGGRSFGKMKIVARAGGSRPPPGARRPRPKPAARPQPSDEENRDGLPVNEEIMSNVVLLIGEDGKMVGKMRRDEALSRARELDLDLVQLDKQEPPCVKIVEYSKLKYELQKRKKEQLKKSIAKRMDLKELKMRYNIDVHDYGVRLRSIQKFLKDGDKVKLIIQFKGRELEFKDLGLKLFDRFQEDIGEEAIVEGKQTKEARNISMVLAPNKGKVSGQSSNAEKSTINENTSENTSTVTAVGAEV